MRQLVWMAEGLGRERWAHTSAVMALIANAHRDPKKAGVFTPDDFNPFAEREARIVLPDRKEAFRLMKQVFIAPGVTPGFTPNRRRPEQ